MKRVVLLLVLSRALMASDKDKPLILFHVLRGNNYLLTSGQWENPPIGKWDNPNYPPTKNASQIGCDKARKECVESAASEIDGTFYASTIYYDIVEWTDDGIIAKDAAPFAS
jgi:hypothetical protein